MEYRIEVNGALRTVAVRRREGRFIVTMGARQWTVDAELLGAHALSLLLTPAAPAGEPGVDVPDPGAARVVSREAHLASVPGEAGQLIVSVGPVPVAVAWDARRRWSGSGAAGAAATGPQRLRAPMPGRVVRVLAQAGTPVAARQPVVVIEAMKMENELRSPVDGIVSEVLVQEGQSVEAGTVLAVVTPQ